MKKIKMLLLLLLISFTKNCHVSYDVVIFRNDKETLCFSEVLFSSDIIGGNKGVRDSHFQLHALCSPHLVSLYFCPFCSRPL